ncbi:pilin [Shewanella youngdeokensis]|uniref:Type II secretion system protein n=1 Tax=Shewanella youngdeokensis TaxID=2999068 RepID=A0ABZ0K4Q9_9GAMM|nr:type II secretion system protein [Shewanella sp. DAU334]
MKRYQKGFSLIELVIVIVILGLLAATAIPRFLNVTEDAEDASVEGVAGGLATAVSFVRSQWEVDGRRNNNVVLDGTRVQLDTRFGFPTGTGGNTATAMNVTRCSEVFNTVLQNAPRNVSATQDARQQRYVVSLGTNLGGDLGDGGGIDIDGNDVTGLDLCVYHLVGSLELDDTTGVPTSALLTDGKGVTYSPGNGQVQSFIN